MRSSVSTEGEPRPRSMRESIEAEICDARNKPLADTPAAILRALTCVPTRAAEALRAMGAGRRGWVRVTVAGSCKTRTVGRGEASCRWTI